MDRLQAGDARFVTVESTLHDIKTALIDLHSGQTAIRDDIKPVLDDISIIKDWIAASKFIQTGTRFLKWTSAIAGFIGVIIVAVKVSAAAFARMWP